MQHTRAWLTHNHKMRVKQRKKKRDANEENTMKINFEINRKLMFAVKVKAKEKSAFVKFHALVCAFNDGQLIHEKPFVSSYFYFFFLFLLLDRNVIHRYWFDTVEKKKRKSPERIKQCLTFQSKHYTVKC